MNRFYGITGFNGVFQIGELAVGHLFTPGGHNGWRCIVSLYAAFEFESLADVYCNHHARSISGWKPFAAGSNYLGVGVAGTPTMTHNRC